MAFGSSDDSALHRDDDELDDLNGDDHDDDNGEMVSLVGCAASSSSSCDDKQNDDYAVAAPRDIAEAATDMLRRNFVISSLGFAFIVFCALLLVMAGTSSSHSTADLMESSSGGNNTHDENQHSSSKWGSSLRNKKHPKQQQHESPSMPVARPGTGGLDEPGYRKTPNRLSPKYLPRTHPSADFQQTLADTWGSWTLEDPKANKRPQDDFYANYPNRDVPRQAFPPNAWQLDADYLAKFLDESIQLVERSMEAILGEYGHSKLNVPGVDFEERSKMFHVSLVNLTSEDYTSELQYDIASSAGWMFQNGWQGLQRRILHAVMTEDSFTYVMGGHSASAGHGNHFWQSYTLQMGKIIEPVFARLGVFFRAHNFGMGGLGTTHNAMGAKDIYGADIDLLYWDSQMTERDPFMGYFLRAGLISGNRAPVIWNTIAGSTPQTFAMETGADVGNIYGGAMAGIGQMTSITDADSLPWAARFMNCDSEINGECASSANRYNTKCWIERDDFSPTRAQLSQVGGQASWHPGWRWHQLLGRTQAFALLRATHAALTQWNSAEGFALSDDAWHVTQHYDAIRAKVTSTVPCEEMKINPLFCTRPIQSRTEFTPRALGYQSSIRSIMKGEHVPRIAPNVYDPPDVDYTHADPPEGEVNVLHIIENGIDFPINLARKEHVDWLTSPPPIAFKSKDYMIPGRGMALIDSVAASDNCDGTMDSWCNRGEDQYCLLHHHNDGRGGMGFDGLSGWLVMNLADVEEGLIAIKMELWRAGGSPATTTWTCENDLCAGEANSTDSEQGRRHLQTVPLDFASVAAVEHSRHLKGAPAPKPCETYNFEFAVDGAVTTWDANTFDAHKVSVERVVDIFELVNDKNLTQGQPRDVELAIRLTGCGRLLTYSLTHVYWA